MQLLMDLNPSTGVDMTTGLIIAGIALGALIILGLISKAVGGKKGKKNNIKKDKK